MLSACTFLKLQFGRSGAIPQLRFGNGRLDGVIAIFALKHSSCYIPEQRFLFLKMTTNC